MSHPCAMCIGSPCLRQRVPHGIASTGCLHELPAEQRAALPQPHLAVSHSCACTGSPCLRQRVHDASTGGPQRRPDLLPLLAPHHRPGAPPSEGGGCLGRGGGGGGGGGGCPLLVSTWAQPEGLGTRQLLLDSGGTPLPGYDLQVRLCWLNSDILMS
eukprot:COSAG01_NODE_6645_length_3566_cov_2.581194_5_plen_157_part_00